MKYKYPKKITIGSVCFNCYYDKNGEAAHFNYQSDREHEGPHIFLGLNGSICFLELIIHELKEIIHLEQDTRLTKRNEGQRIFVYNHAEHTDLCARLAGLLTKFIK